RSSSPCSSSCSPSARWGCSACGYPTVPDEPIVPAVELPVPEVPKEVVAAVDIPVTAAETKEVEASGVFWLLVLGGLLFVVLGWFLPWFVEPTSGGIGFSPQDVVSSAPTGIGTVFAYIIGVAMLGLIAGVAY